MKKSKVIQIVFIGNIVLNLPFVLSIIYLFSFVTPNNKIPFLIGLFILGAFYWSYMAAWYRSYSIKKMNTKKEFFYWKKLSVYSLLLWPDNFILTRTEFWNDESYQSYMKTKNELI